MSDSTVKKQTLDAFIKQREKRQNDTGIEANRLVNLYRQLPLFGDSFLETYNKMLLDTSPEVQMTLSDIVGGSVVRQYLEFLKGRQKALVKEVDEELVEELDDGKLIFSQKESYLPSADEIQPFNVALSAKTPSVMPQNTMITEELLKSQTSFFEQSLAKQTELIGKAIEKMQPAVSLTHQNPVESLPNAVQFEKSQKAQQEAFKTALEQVLQAQNQALAENLKQIIHQTSEMTSKQMETLEAIMKNQQDKTSAYPIVEEYAPERYVVKRNCVEEEPSRPYKIKDIFLDEEGLKKKDEEFVEMIPDEVDMDVENEGFVEMISDEQLSEKTPRKHKVQEQGKQEIRDEQPFGDDVEILSEIDLSSGME